MEKKVHHIFAESIYGVITILVLAVFFFIKVNKDKTEFNKISGKITAIKQPDSNDRYPNRDPAKFRYIQIENYQFPFELFIGKDAGDFKPTFEQIDKLQRRSDYCLL